MLVTGEAGIGKTMLVRRFLEECGRVRTLYAAGDENESALPYGVLAQLAGQIPGAEGGRPAAGADGRYTDPLVAGADFLDLLGRAEEGCRAVAVVLDDAHWADTPSLHAITFALRRLRVDRVITLVLVRDETDPRLPEGLRRLFAEDRTLRLALGGLEAAEIRELSGVWGRSRLLPWAAARLCEHTRGNPLQVRTLLRQTPPEVFAATDPLPVPSDHQRLIRGVLDGCSQETRRFVAAGSVLGATFPVHLAAEAAGELERPLAALEEAVRSGLLEEHSLGGIPQAGFPHPLVKAAVYRGLGAQERAALHHRAAGLVTDSGAALDHQAAAATGPDARLAERIASFAQELTEAGAWAAAAAKLRAAARLSPGTEEREHRLLASAECLLLAGDIAQAQAMMDELRLLCPGSARDYVLGRLALAAGQQDEAARLLAAAWHHRSPGDPPHIAARAAEQLAWLGLIRGDGGEAVKWAGRCEAAGGAAPLDVTGLGLALTGRPDDALRAVTPRQRRSGNAIGTDDHRTVHGAADARPTDSDSTDTKGRRSVGAGGPDRTAAVEKVDGLLARGILLLWRGRAREGRAVLVRAAARHRNGGLPGLGVLALGFEAEACYRSGDWDAALTQADLAVSLAHDTDQRWLLAFVHATAAAVPAARGDAAAAGEHIALAQEFAALLGDASDIAYAATAAAQIAAATGDDASVVAALSPLAGPGLAHRDSLDEPGIFPWPALLAEALARTGRSDEAAALLAPHESTAQARDCAPARAALARARGTLCAVRGQRDAAESAFDTAQQLLAGLALPFEEALTHLAHGARLRRWGRRSAAIVQLEAAHTQFTALAATPYLLRCESELAGCGRVRRAAAGPGQAPAAALLTPQELAAARLAATGLTNRQIARELLLSTKTIEHHLGHVYAKLGIRSRAALAVVLNAPARSIPVTG